MTQRMPLATANDVALIIARREGLLVEETGELRCWRCRRVGALLPSLRCKACFGLTSLPDPPVTSAAVPRPPVEDPWIAAADRLRDDRALTPERARAMLDRAKRHPTATAAKLSQLEGLFQKRYGQQRLPLHSAVGTATPSDRRKANGAA